MTEWAVSPREEQLQAQSCPITRACRGCSERCPGHARCSHSTAPCHPALPLAAGLGRFLQLAPFLKVREAGSVKPALSKERFQGSLRCSGGAGAALEPQPFPRSQLTVAPGPCLSCTGYLTDVNNSVTSDKRWNSRVTIQNLCYLA